MFYLLQNKDKKTNLYYVIERIEIAGVMTKKIILDFEIVMYQAVFDIFPQTEVFGCRFNLGPVWFRKIKNIPTLRFTI